MIVMNDFEKIIAFTLHWEGADLPNGGLHTDPADPGGTTKYGISQRTYPTLDIVHLTRQDAIDKIYYPDYWLRSGPQRSNCDRLSLPANMAHFDCVVNVGNAKTAKDGTFVWHGHANMILQRAVNVPDDGYIGPMTLQSVTAADPIELASKLITERDRYYDSLGVWSNPFREGWHNRTKALHTFLANGDNAK